MPKSGLVRVLQKNRANRECVSVSLSISVYTYIFISVCTYHLYLYLDIKELTPALVGGGVGLASTKSSRQASKREITAGADAVMLSPEAAWRQNSFPCDMCSVRPFNSILSFTPISTLGDRDQAHSPISQAEGMRPT